MVNWTKRKLLEWLSDDNKDRPRRNGDAARPRNHLVVIITFAILILIISLMFPRGKSFEFSDLKQGLPYLGPEIIAPFTFSVNKSPAKYQADLDEVVEQVAPVFRLDKTIADSQKSHLKGFLKRFQQLANDAVDQPELLNILFKDHNMVISDDNLRSLLYNNSSVGAKLQGPASESAKSVSITPAAKVNAMSDDLLNIANMLYSVGILNIKKTSLPGYVSKISIQRHGEEVLEDLRFYLDPEETRTKLLEKLREVFVREDYRTNLGYGILDAFIKPNVLYLEAETRERQKVAGANVPLAKDRVLEGERIIDSHEIVTSEHIEALHSLATAKAQRNGNVGDVKNIFSYLGKLLITTIILVCFLLLLNRLDRAILTDQKRMALIVIIILLVMTLGFIITRLSLSGLLIPVAVGSMLLTIFFSVEVGFIGTVALAMLLGALRGNEYNIAFISLITGSVAILSVYKVRTRNWVIRTIATLTGAYIVASAIINFLNYSSFQVMVRDWGFGVINSFLAPILTYGLVVILEFIFEITTDMTLLEFSDLNQPILKELGMRAPGTYHHSQIVGSLSEAAAEAIGANSLLARVGAYYHDIGKIEKSEYFIENQQKGINPHERLSPNMSCLILQNHVRKGIDIARQYRIPNEIVDFIAEHHGTNIMSYFFQKATEKSSGETLNEADFRYPGPKPHTRETGIVMLADAVEAASRVLKEPTPSRIRNVVEHIIDERFKSGELDNSPLTLADLNKISASFQKILVGIFHGRIEYQGHVTADGPGERKKLFSKTKTQAKVERL